MTATLSLEPGRRITTFAVPTRNRPERLVRCLSTYAASFLNASRAPRILVMDDSSEEAVAQHNHRIAQRLAATYGGAVDYVSKSRRSLFADSIAAEAGLPRETIRLALVGSGCRGPGPTRNAIQIATLGERMFSADDDTICNPGVPAEVSNEYTIDVHWNPREKRFYRNRASAYRSVAPSSLNILREHERLLGASIRDLPTSLPCLNWGAPSSRVSEREEHVQRVMLTMNGVVGHAGVHSPSYLLTTVPPVGGCGRRYRDAVARQLVRETVAGPTVSPTSFFCSMFFAIDNSTALPPFLPFARGEDVVFGKLLRVLRPGAIFGYLPFCLRHNPSEPRIQKHRAVWTDLGVSLFEVFCDLLASLVEESRAAQPQTRLTRLGKSLVGLGSQRPSECEDLWLALLQRRLESRRSLLEALVERFGADYPDWRRDVVKHLTSVRPRLRAGLVLDDGSVIGSRLGRWLRGCGELLQAWSSICEAAHALRKKGRGLGYDCRVSPLRS